MAKKKISKHHLIGQKFGRWTVIQQANNIDKRTLWFCECECGVKNNIDTSSLISGNSRSCGCLRNELRLTKIKHGMADKVPEYNVWQAMRRRCNNPKDAYYADYGGRGIYVCQRWNDFSNFLADMGSRPSPKHQLDRFPDNDGPYSPENCRWATASENTSHTRRNLYFVIGGERRCLMEWVRYFDLDYRIVHARIRKGFSIERAITQPVRKSPRRKT